MQTTATIDQGRPAAGFARAATAVQPGRGMVWARRAISGFVSVFLLFDGAARLVRFAPYVEGTVKFGYPEHLASPIGLVLLAAALLYVIPRTAVLGAILLTGYLGGATASHVRVEDPFFLFAATFGVLVWAGLYLREPRLRALIPLRA
ncbi:DoxX family protein [Longimicrobium sp.]|uniref:DoxX family protein n=1 Tax=Longimicrobium sp. TaxID=2029185 RepID=UPI002F94478E